ncbi:MAG: hypothetical protein ACPG5Z_00265 [Pseudoalteromonas sp.]
MKITVMFAIIFYSTLAFSELDMTWAQIEKEIETMPTGCEECENLDDLDPPIFEPEVSYEE